jgi:D-alanyl-D-alanine carboxypeptidase
VSRNGLLTKSERVGLKSAPGQQLEAPAAASWDRMWDAVLSTYAWDMELTDSYRPRSVQDEIFLDRYRPQATGSGPFGDVRHYNGRRYVRVKGYAAAIPGTSNHGWGRAVDITDMGGFNTSRYRALSAVAGYYGWSNAAGRRIGEWWHWEYTYANDQARRRPVPKRLTVTSAQVRAMQRVLRVDDDARWGPDTDHAALAVREASVWGGHQFPWGVRATQRVIGVNPSGRWGAASGAAHDKTVGAMQRILGVPDDDIWGNVTEAKFQRFRRAVRR